MRVGILGATGMVGQQYISLLEKHPWFSVAWVAASERSAGKSYADAVAGRWHVAGEMPQSVKGLIVQPISAVSDAAASCDFVFSALDSPIAKEWEHQYAAAGIPVVSNASTHRHDPDVPMLIPEINHDHTDIIPVQQKARGWGKGFIAVKPNCSLQSYLTPLFALHDAFGVKDVIITTLQAVSGSGHPGVSSFDVIDNVIPYIGGEEEKSEREPMKILGRITDGQIVPASGISIAAHCNRVGVIDGHLACVSVRFEKKPTREEILSAWESFSSLPQEKKLPSAPPQAIIYNNEPDRPQPRLDRYNGRGMAVTVGRLRECPVFDWRFSGLSHNTIRGAAGGGILNAELLKEKGYITER
ncbi:MAG: aspartate-semialdehyde dehydrogenase [archaeon]